MKTLTVESEIQNDGKLRIEVPCDLPPGRVEVVLTVRPQSGGGAIVRPRWADLYGLGRDVWQGIDAQQYVRELRQDRESLR